VVDEAIGTIVFLKFTKRLGLLWGILEL